MNRKKFLKSFMMLPLVAKAMNLQNLNKFADPLIGTQAMPVLFLGHGSPMNAIEENEFVRGWRTMGQTLPKPNAILCISAHWETKGTFVTAMEHPPTIHDFGGFPQALFDVQYPAPGSPELARTAKDTIKKANVELDEKWGLDHGAWSVIRRLYPDHNVPVVQLSLDYRQSAQYHYDLAKELSSLRKKGVLIIGSGNMVHNLPKVDWANPDKGFDWAIEANEKFKKIISENDHKQLMNYHSLGKAIELSVPTPEHYLPLLYALALQEKNEELNFFNDKTIMGSISMTSLKIGNS